MRQSRVATVTYAASHRRWLWYSFQVLIVVRAHAVIGGVLGFVIGSCRGGTGSPGNEEKLLSYYHYVQHSKLRCLHHLTPTIILILNNNNARALLAHSTVPIFHTTRAGNDARLRRIIASALLFPLQPLAVVASSAISRQFSFCSRARHWCACVCMCVPAWAPPARTAAALGTARGSYLVFAFVRAVCVCVRA